MEYRYLGDSGLQVSLVGFGNMVNYDINNSENLELVKKAFDAGINFFDTAEGYQEGKCETVLGQALKKYDIPREEVVISDKLYFGNTSINSKRTLNRKHLKEGTNQLLERLQLDYVDVMFAHLYDPETTVYEVCQSYNQIIEDGHAFYWGTSNWPVSAIMEAHSICDKYGMIHPICEQSEYNMINRQRVESDLGYLYDKYKMGLTAWSPLAGGFLTGKYNEGIPQDSRVSQGIGNMSAEHLNNFMYNKFLNNQDTMASLKQLGNLSKELGCTQAQLSIAWAMKNKDVSTLILGAKSVAQFEDSMKALQVYKTYSNELEEKVENILKNRPPTQLNYATFKPFPPRR